MTDIKNFTLKGLGNNVQFGRNNGRVKWNTDHFELRNFTDTAFVNLYVSSTPIGPNAVVTKEYVDSLVQGLSPKEKVKAATSAVLSDSYTYNNGTAGAGATLTKTTNGAFPLIDGVTVTVNDRILIKNETGGNQPYNGIYILTTGGDGSTPWVLTRASDNDIAAEFSGAFLFVEQGSANQDTGWICATNNPIVVGTTNIVWQQFSTFGQTTASNGIIKIANDFQLNIQSLISTNPITNADNILFYDTSTNSHAIRSISNTIADLNIVTSVANGLLTRTGVNAYTSRTITPSVVANLTGINIVNGDGVSGNPTIGLSITGLPSGSFNDNMEFPFHSNTGVNSKTSWFGLKNQVRIDLALITRISGLVNKFSTGGATQTIGTLPPFSLVVGVEVEILGAWDQPETIGVGISGNSSIMNSNENDPLIIGKYVGGLSYTNSSSFNQTITAAVSNGGASSGQARVIVYFIKTS